MSRWTNWSRGSKPVKMFGDFLNEGPVDQGRTSNPTGTGQLKPADRARQLGLQSDGKGGYLDPQTGQIVARTVNNELVFYSSAPGGGAVSDGSGGSAAANPSTSWQDPITGLMTTPPSQPESPNEIAAVPDPVPAQAPAGYNAFILKRKQELYVQDYEARKQQEMMPPPPVEPNPDAEMGEPDQGMEMPMENYQPGDLLKRMANSPAGKADAAGVPLGMGQHIQRAMDQRPQQIAQPQQQEPAPQQNPAPQPQQQQQSPPPQQPETSVTPQKPEVEELDVEDPDALNPTLENNQTLMDFVKEKQQQLLGNDKKVKNFMDKKFSKFQNSLESIENEEVRKSMEDLFRKAYGFEGRVNVGAGLNSLGKLDVENLVKAREKLVDGVDYNDKEAIATLVKGIRNNQISPEFLEASFNALPPQLISGWKGKGNAGKGEFGMNHYLGDDADGNEMRGQLGKNDRAKLMWKYYLEQGGLDGYTGQPLDINNFDLEHLLPASQSGDLDEFKFREGPNNHVLVNSNVNQSKSDLSMEDWFKQQVDPYGEKDDDYWSSRDKILDFRNTIGPREEGLVKALASEDGGFAENLDLETLLGHFDNEDNFLKGEKKTLAAFAKASGDPELIKEARKIETASGLAKALAMKMGLPRGYNKQKNVPGSKARTNSLGSDNYYRAILASMMGKSPEERKQMGDVYRQALRTAEDATAPGESGMSAFAKHMVDNGGVDMELLKKYPKLAKLFSGGPELEEESSPESFYELFKEKYGLTLKQ